MRIQHNIMAMSAYRNYTNNVSAMKKNLEKLSSGYKINRAGDDAAGLAISEKMRAQITGLETAQKNAKDGISLVQTAEGALTEVHDMLNRMVELASQSANGTYDNTTDRAQMQKEIEQLKSEINRIADSSNFNGINLLDGSMATGVTAGRAGNFGLPDVGTTLGVNSILHVDDPAATGEQTVFGVDFADTKIAYSRGDEITIKVGKNTFTMTAKASAAAGTLAGQDIASALTNGHADFDIKMNGETYDATKVEFGDDKFKMEVDGNKLMFKGSATDFQVNLDVDISAKSGTGDAITLTTVTGTQSNTGAAEANKAAITGTYTAGTASTKEKIVIAVASLAGPGKQTYTLGGKTIEIESTASMSATDVANKLKAEIGSLAGYNITAANTGVTIEAATPTATANNMTGIKTLLGAAASATATTIGGLVSGTEGLYDQYEFDVSGITDLADIAGKGNASIVEFDFGGEKIKITGLSEDSTASEVAAKLAKALNNKLSDTAAGKYTATLASDGTTVVLTASAMATAAGAIADPTMKVIEGDVKITGDYNKSTIKPNTLNEADKPRLASTVIKLEKSMVKEGSSITIGNKDYTFTTDKSEKGQDGKVYIGDLDSSDLDYLTKATVRLADAAKDNGVWTVGEVEPGSGKITLMEATKADGTALNATDDVVNGKKTNLTTLEGIAATLGYKAADTVGNGLTLQIGDTADDYNKLTVSIQDMHAESLGIDGINIGTQEGAAAAMDKIKAAINQVSDVRGTLGATQNRLDHTINNLSVMTENIQDAESTIRDVDIAEEMMAYTKNNILIQSAQAMLAQANQVPQGVLQLLG